VLDLIDDVILSEAKDLSGGRRFAAAAERFLAALGMTA